jgi:hypothetical protein
MSKVITIDNKYTWKIQKISDPVMGSYFHGACGRLNLKLDARSLQELIDLAEESMYNLFKDQYVQGQLNELAFKCSATYRVRDFEGFIELSVPVILED